MINYISSWVLVLIKPTVLIQNVSSYFNGVRTTWTIKVFPREKP